MLPDTRMCYKLVSCCLRPHLHWAALQEMAVTWCGSKPLLVRAATVDAVSTMPWSMEQVTRVAPQHPVPTPPAFPMWSSGSLHLYLPRWRCTSPSKAARSGFLARLESPGISVLHLSNLVLWGMWKASKTDTCWLQSSQLLSPKYLWPLFLMFTFKEIQTCVGCKRKEGEKRKK